jgi:hypothetical protein
MSKSSFPTTKRYYVYAKREGGAWTDWTQVDSLKRAKHHAVVIKEAGFIPKIYDRKRKRNMREETK